MSPEERDRLSKLEEKHVAIADDVAEIKKDVRETRDAIVGAKIGWKILLGVSGAIGGLAGIATSYLRSTGRG